MVEIEWINGREALVGLAPKRGTFISVCVSPESVYGAVFSFGKNERFDLRIDAARDPNRPGSGPDAVIQIVQALARKAGVSVKDLSGVSIAMHAPVDRRTGKIGSWALTRLPGWREVAIQETLSTILGVPVVVENDANLGALAEWTWGAGRGTECFLYVMCAAGIGGGLVLDGKLHRGANGMALEIGHIVLEQTGPVCFCGSRGCLSTVASERSILLALEGSESPKRSLAEVIVAAREGDPVCQRVLYEAGRGLGRALSNMAKIIAPGVIAVGGVLATAGDLVFTGIQTAIEENNVPAFSPSAQLKPALVRDDATLLGGLAALMGVLGQGVSELPEWLLLAGEVEVMAV